MYPGEFLSSGVCVWGGGGGRVCVSGTSSCVFGWMTVFGSKPDWLPGCINEVNDGEYLING